MKKVLKKTSVFPANPQVVFRELKKLKTLQYVAKPFATFTPADQGESLEWKQGRTFPFRFKVFGILPFGIHRITVEEFDESSQRISTKEYNPHVPVWNHTIYLKELSENRTEYTDEVEIDAGWKTSFVYLWAKIFYAHRQRKWKKLLKGNLIDERV